MSVNLMVQFGDKRVSYDDLGLPALPAQTESYMPVSHKMAVDTLTEFISASGRRVVQSAYAFGQGGLRMFGLMEIESPDGAASMMVGIRNSYNKTLPVGIAAGSVVRVCSNGIFAGKVVSMRKHTLNVLRDLNAFMGGAIERLGKFWQHHELRMDAYRTVGLRDLDAHNLIARAYMLGGISKTLVADTLDQWHRPAHDFGEKTLWRLHNAFTEVIKGRIDLLPTRSEILHGLLDPLAMVPALVIDAEVVELPA